MDKKKKMISSKTDLPSLEMLKNELKREKYKRRFRRVLRLTVNNLIVVAAVAALIATLVLPVLQIAGISMEPSLNDGDIVVLVKTDKLKTGDLCAFYYSNKILIKRVIGIPGDYIYIDKEGTVFVNNIELEEPYISQKSLGECDIEFPYQVTENNYFMMVITEIHPLTAEVQLLAVLLKTRLLGKLFLKYGHCQNLNLLNNVA